LGVIQKKDQKMDNLVVTVLGHSDSGKSTTWNDLFGKTVRTGTKVRRLYLRKKEYVEVFLVSGSPEERETYVGKIIGKQKPRIVLCSMQYRNDVTQTIDYFNKNSYSNYCHWLNPGYSDPFDVPMFDTLGLINNLLSLGSTISIQNGKGNRNQRVQLLREYIYGWATFRNLIQRRLKK